MIVAIASDHKGFLVKQNMTDYLTKLGYNMIDYGTTDEKSTDYPIYAFKVGEAIKNKEAQMGILICGTGIGMSIACNKVKGIRCAKVDSIEESKLSRLHNDANVIAISYNIKNANDIVLEFLKTDFSNEERHNRRIEMIDNYDN